MVMTRRVHAAALFSLILGTTSAIATASEGAANAPIVKIAPTRPALFPPQASKPVRPDCPADAVLPNNFPQFDTLCLVERGGRLYMRILPKDVAYPATYRALGLSEILTILASVRASNVWPMIEAYLGPDGERIRTEIRQQARRILQDGCSFADQCGSTVLENQAEGNIAIALRAANLLSSVGYTSEALAVLDANLPKPGADGSLAPVDEYSWHAIKLKMATIPLGQGNFGEADARLRELATARLANSSLQINAMITRAALLAQLHRAEEALALVNEAELRFLAEAKGAEVRGSNRHFAWIKACALKELGRVAEAKSVLRGVRSELKSMNNQFGMADDSETIRLRSALCRGDDSEIANLLQDDKLLLGAPGALIFQKSKRWMYPGDAETIERAENRLRATGKLAEFRQLPSGLTSALNAWRDN